MTATKEITDNSTAEAEAVGRAIERCSRAEVQFGSGEISLIELYKIYQEIYQNSIPAGADVDFGPWSQIFYRRRRLLQLINEKHLRKSRGCRGGHRGSHHWDVCDWMDCARDVHAQLILETDAAKRSRLRGELFFWERIVHDVAKRERREQSRIACKK